MDDDIREMRQETTGKAIDFIQTNSHMQALVIGAKTKKATIADMAKMLEKYSRNYAYAHGNKFGDLFDVELDLVDWYNVVAEV